MTQINIDIFSLVLSNLDAFECSIFSTTSKESLKLVKDKYCSIYDTASDLKILPSNIYEMIHKSDFTLYTFHKLLTNEISVNIIKNISNDKICATVKLFQIINIQTLSQKTENFIKKNIWIYFEKLYLLRHSEEYLNNKIMIYIYTLRVTDLYWYRSNINPFFLMENMILLLRNEYNKTKFCNFDDWFDNKIQNTISTCSYMINIANVSKNIITKWYCTLVLYNYIIYVIKNNYYNDDIKSSFHFFADRMKLFKDNMNTLKNKNVYFKKEIFETFDDFQEIYNNRIMTKLLQTI